VPSIQLDVSSRLARDNRRLIVVGIVMIARQVLDFDAKKSILPLNANTKFVLGQIQRINDLRVGVLVTGRQLDQHASVALEWLRKRLVDPDQFPLNRPERQCALIIYSKTETRCCELLRHHQNRQRRMHYYLTALLWLVRLAISTATKNRPDHRTHVFR